MAALPGYQETVTCPYNKSHNILKERFQTHLVKCAKNYPNISLKPCPFNTTHLIVESDYDECEDRGNFDHFRYPIAAPVQENRPRQAEPVYVPLPEADENWDDLW